ncbi:MAG: PTS sugar transporter subunit IIB [Deltaproteobacteria bacterium]|nr:PTS sugar transporter subunit IIB [Candidatus Anaeroferrophillus wilburensis]MBN2889465.1 PTS sugar transporter subunit IIB [Deltaproteobacteria bacterium]
MTTLLVRVDDRLIHGQVVETWVPYLKAVQIIVADDDVSRDPFKKRIMEMAAPPLVNVIIKTVPDAVSYVKENFFRPTAVNTIFLLSSIKDALQALDLELPCNRLNLGNIHYESDKTPITNSISLDSSEIALLHKIDQKGVAVFVQPVPRVPPHDFFALLAKKII